MAYLVKTQPSLLDVKAADGVTPLQLAYRLGRLDAARVLVNAGADQTTKDQRRNNLLHAVLCDTPDAKRLTPMLDLLDRGALVPMLKERNKLEQSGQTPLHQYCAGISNYSGKQLNSALRVIKLLIDISPETAKQALKMLDGTGNTPLHTLIAKDSDSTIIRTLIDFDPSLLCCENAVGRTPAEVAHDRYLSSRIRAPGHNYYQPDNSVSSLVSAPPSQFVKHKPCKEPKEHEDKSTVAKNWLMCSEIMERNGQPKRTLVSLNSANFVSQRLGDKHMRDRYRFEVVKIDEDAAVLTGSQDGESEAGVAEPTRVVPIIVPAATAPKTNKRGRTDAICARYFGDNSAWAAPKRQKTGGDESDSVEESSEESSEEENDVLPRCEGCGERHHV